MRSGGRCKKELDDPYENGTPETGRQDNRRVGVYRRTGGGNEESSGMSFKGNSFWLGSFCRGDGGTVKGESQEVQ